jgi:hypothetical protein
MEALSFVPRLLSKPARILPGQSPASPLITPRHAEPILECFSVTMTYQPVWHRFAGLENRGRLLHRKILNCRLRHASDTVAARDVYDAYNVTREAMPPDERLNTQLDSVSISANDFTYVTVESRIPSDPSKPRKAFSNMYNIKDGGIICYDNYRDRDRNLKAAQMRFSDIIWQTYVESARLAEVPVWHLRVIWRYRPLG